MIETGALMRLNASSASMVQQTKQGQQHARGALQSHQHPPPPQMFWRCQNQIVRWTKRVENALHEESLQNFVVLNLSVC
jgi:hypothetical protein